MIKFFKKITTITMLFGALIAFPSIAKEKLLVGTDTAFVPFEFKENGKYTGFDVDLWDAIAKKLGVDYELRPMDFNGIIPALQTKNIDVAIAGIGITEPRKKAIDLTDGYYDADLLIAVPSDNTQIKKFSDLAGKRVGVKQGTVGATYMKANVKATYIEFPNIDNAYLDLRVGHLDAVVHDSPNVMYYVKVAGDGKVKVTGTDDSVLPQQYAIGLPKKSVYTARINQAIRDLKSDGTYRKIYVKWFNQEPK